MKNLSITLIGCVVSILATTIENSFYGFISFFVTILILLLFNVYKSKI